jgi:hypothetical protein
MPSQFDEAGRVAGVTIRATIVANGRAPLARASLQSLAAIPGARPTIAKLRTALEKLKRSGILTKNAAGTSLDDPLFAEFLRRRFSAGGRRPAGSVRGG